MHKYTLALLAALLCMPTFAYAQKEDAPYEPPPPKDMPHVYSPPPCEFTAGFPEEPFIKEVCDGGESGDECYNQVSYTATFGLSATVDVKVICNAIDEGIKEKYDESVMVKTLEAMSGQSIENQYDVNYTEDEDGRFKMAGLVGDIMVGMSPGIYIAQMWIGEESAMTAELQLIGDPVEEGDAMFRDILRSIRYKGDDNTAETPEEEVSPSPAD